MNSPGSVALLGNSLQNSNCETEGFFQSPVFSIFRAFASSAAAQGEGEESVIVRMGKIKITKTSLF